MSFYNANHILKLKWQWKLFVLWNYPCTKIYLHLTYTVQQPGMLDWSLGPCPVNPGGQTQPHHQLFSGPVGASVAAQPEGRDQPVQA